MTKLLILANEGEFEEEQQRLENSFEEVDRKSLADLMIDVGSERTSNILVDGDDLNNWDSVYIKPEPKAFNYTRVLMEIVSMKEIKCNLDPSSVFILTKKPYLFKVLADKGVKIPRQVSISTEKGMTELGKDIDFPVIAKKYSNLELKEVKVFEEFDELKTFAELTEHGEDFLMIQEKIEEDIFDILYIEGSIISLKVDGSPWSESGEISRTYHSISDSQREVVEKAVDSIGTHICRLRMAGDRVMDMDTDPQLEMFKQKSGKNVFGRISDALKEDDEE